jgi:NADPH:quinone reductase-like Zn-dependent oxidoreductase
MHKEKHILTPKGPVIIEGKRGTIEIDPRLMMGKESEIRGVFLTPATPAEVNGCYAALVAALESGVLKIVVGKKIPLAEAARAHREIIEEKARGKMILVP